jgi:pimeloyl-ACP methyl ester carboxylesterase
VAPPSRQLIVRVASSDGVDVAVHELGGRGPTLLISHATGFHGHCYAPLARALAGTFRCVSFDYRGHGDTAHPDRPVDWRRNADDCIAVAEALGGPVLGFGHSMGGACLLLAAARRPELFAALAVFEPIVPPLDSPLTLVDDNAMSAAAIRRRATFASMEAALDNFASKPPLNQFRADALHAYVHHGFRHSADGVTLKCTPQIEAGTFGAATASHVWDDLPGVDAPTVVAAGELDGSPPPTFADGVAARLPRGSFVRLEHANHFTPMSDPDRLARLLAGWLPA